MEKAKVVMCSVLSLLGLLSAATGFAAEATKLKRSQIKVITSDSVSIEQCSYSRSPAYNLGFTSALFLLMAHIIVSVASGCFCCRKGPAPSRSNWTIALICFVISWFTFIIAFLVLLTAAALNDTGNSFCYIVKPGVFSIGSVLSLVTIALGIVYYLCLSSSKHNVAANTTTGIAMGQARFQRE